MQKLKSALWLSIGRLVDSTCIPLRTNATPQFIGALTELVYAQVTTVAVDVERFARYASWTTSYWECTDAISRHAGRTIIDMQDVLLLARRNEGLEGMLKAHIEALKIQNKAGQGKGKGKAGI